MQLEDPRIDGGKPSNRVFPLWLLTLGSGLIAGSLAAFGGELTNQAFHKEPQYPASFLSLGSSERAIARPWSDLKRERLPKRTKRRLHTGCSEWHWESFWGSLAVWPAVSAVPAFEVR